MMRAAKRTSLQQVNIILFIFLNLLFYSKYTIADAKSLQRTLNYLGCDAGLEDGVWNGKTKAAYAYLAVQNNEKYLNCGEEDCVQEIFDTVRKIESEGKVCEREIPLVDHVSLHEAINPYKLASKYGCKLDDFGDVLHCVKNTNDFMASWEMSKATNEIVVHYRVYKDVGRSLSLEDIATIFLARYGDDAVIIRSPNAIEICYGGCKLIANDDKTGAKSIDYTGTAYMSIDMTKKSDGRTKLEVFRKNEDA